MLNKKILIAVTASIAAYKVAFLVRLLVKKGADVKVIMTPSARDFITPLTLSTLSGHPVITEPFDESDGSWNSHVELGKWPDAMIVAPLSANTMAKMANGIADNFLLTTYLSADCPVFFAPAMDLDMFRHPSTQKNLSVLESFGHHLIAPQSGELASGLCGAGRMEEPEQIVSILEDFFSKNKPLKGKKVLISAGPTHENIDPVRYIGNYSSGKMGFALAEKAAAMGAEVFLIAGPVFLSCKHPSIKRIDVVSARQMHEAVMQYFPSADLSIMAAAVADFRPEEIAESKIKKSDARLSILLEPTIDILAGMGKKKKKGQVLAGFALETNDEIANAQSKLNTKKLDFIVLNSMNDSGAGFQKDTNKVSILTDTGKIIEYPLKSKDAVACDILTFSMELLNP